MADWDGSDDDWDADDAEMDKRVAEQEKAVRHQQRRDDGLDSESEEEKPAPNAGGKPKPKPKKKLMPVYQKPEENLTPEQQRLRLRRLQEEQEEMIGSDMFAGCAVDRDEDGAAPAARAVQKEAEVAVVVVDSFDRLELKVQADVENLCATCVAKVEKSKAKGCSVKFLADLMKQLDADLELKDLEALDKVLTTFVKDKQVAKGATAAKENKANTKLSKTTKFNTHDEYSCIYGGGGDDEEWTQEEWDDWVSKEAKSNAEWEQSKNEQKEKKQAQTAKQQEEWEAEQQDILDAKLQADVAKAEAEAKAKAKAKAKAEPKEDPKPGEAAPKTKSKKK